VPEVGEELDDGPEVGATVEGEVAVGAAGDPGASGEFEIGADGPRYVTVDSPITN
jgi:hypothetical protein